MTTSITNKIVAFREHKWSIFFINIFYFCVQQSLIQWNKTKECTCDSCERVKNQARIKLDRFYEILLQINIIMICFSFHVSFLLEKIFSSTRKGWSCGHAI